MKWSDGMSPKHQNTFYLTSTTFLASDFLSGQAGVFDLVSSQSHFLSVQRSVFGGVQRV